MFAGLALALLAGRARADGIIDLYADSVAPFTDYAVFFPNWSRAPAASFLISEMDDTACGAGNLTGITIVNYGTATGGAGGDLAGVYWKYVCAAGATGLITMTFAGTWNQGAGLKPVWTWAGSQALPNDPCTNCFCYPALQVYVDVGSCPVDGATIQLGPGFNTTGSVGGVADSCNTRGPATTTNAIAKTIMYVMKSSSPEVAAPGDTITYSVYYGLPGAANLTNIWIFDTLPSYTHYVPGSASPQAPDSGWDPDPGPPQRLLWTIASPGAPGAGPTRLLTFKATIDWGNAESFEPGSGDTAAPEGSLLVNRAQMAWDPTGCAPGRVSNSSGTTVRRYLFWTIGDNDVLFAGSLGAPPDEMVYSMFIKNLSAKLTWHSVSVWDTVPAELDTWAPNLGMDDPCLGWTMTPSGCAQASAGKQVNGGNTILTWVLDMPPSFTIELRWKAAVKATAVDGDTATNVASLFERGRPGTLNGTGHQGTAKNFTHIAPIKLRTTYVSYLGFGGSGLGKVGFLATFYPLNKATNFELRGLEYGAVDAWTTGGGVSASIGNYIGTCISGFTCAVGGSGGVPGCLAERIPAAYLCYVGGGWLEQTYGAPEPCSGNPAPSGPCSNLPGQPFHHIYKVVSNSPVLWQAFACNGNDAHTFAPSTSLSFSGFIHYAFSHFAWGARDYFNVINTSVGASGTLDPALTTTVHQFWWDYTSNQWAYDQSFEIDAESQVLSCPLPRCNAHYRWVSSQARNVIREGRGTYFSGESNFEQYDPERTTGAMSASMTGQAIYVFANMKPGYQENQVIITNTGTTAINYRIEVYIPEDTINVPACKPPWMNGTSGRWYLRKSDTVPGDGAGWAAIGPAARAGAATNPKIYGLSCDASYPFTEPPSGTGGIWRVVLTNNGTNGGININSGAHPFSVYGGGSVMHPEGGQQVGTEFWMGMTTSWCFGGCPCDSPFKNLYAVDIFCPKTGMTVKGEDNMGFSATYVTTGPDQDVAFLRLTNDDSVLPLCQKKLIKFTITGGNAIAMYNECQPSHKFFTAPFVQMGEHYNIITPPVVYVGQVFWITVQVVPTGGGLDTTYTGITSFTSTDRGAQIEGKGMDSYNYQWVLADAGDRVFIRVIMTTLGLQSIIAADTQDGSITGLTTLQVVGADVKLTKEPPIQVSASGDIVQFKICWSNYSTATATTFTITDEVPNGTVYYPDAPSNHFCGATKGFGSATVAYSTTTNTPGAYLSMGGTPSTAVQFLRWTIPAVGVLTTGCVCFKVTVE